MNFKSKLPITILAVMFAVSACQTNNNYADDDTGLVVAQVQQPEPSPTAKLEAKLARLEAIFAKLEATISRQTEQKSVVVVKPAPVVISKPKAAPVPPVVVTKPEPKPVVVAAMKPKLVGQPIKVAKQRIQILSLDIFSLLSDTTLSKQARKTEFSKLLVNYLNIPEIGRLVMDNKYWDNTNETQRASYLKAFNNYVLNIFSTKFDRFDGKANPVKGFTITNVEVVGKKKDILVRSKISTDTNIYHVDWRLRKDNGTFKIIDLSTKGISLVLTLRGDFGGVLNSKGVNGLIKILKNRKVHAASIT
jgi:phospholipid transport system substrate-binding protein